MRLESYFSFVTSLDIYCITFTSTSDFFITTKKVVAKRLLVVTFVCPKNNGPVILLFKPSFSDVFHIGVVWRRRHEPAVTVGNLWQPSSEDERRPHTLSGSVAVSVPAILSVLFVIVRAMRRCKKMSRNIITLDHSLFISFIYFLRRSNNVFNGFFQIFIYYRLLYFFIVYVNFTRQDFILFCKMEGLWLIRS